MATKPNYKPIPLVALVLAWLVPGAGHIYIGRVGRGIILFVVVGATFWAGIAAGGVLAVDYQRHRFWFAAEMLSGVHGLVGWQRQKHVYDRLAAEPEIGPPPHPAAREDWDPKVDEKLAAENIALTGPMETVALAYCGIAGLLNLICIFDAFMLALMGVVGENPPPADGPKETAA